MERVFDVHMIHFHGDLGHQDATVDRHYVPHRLFKIENDLSYPEVEHSVLQGNFVTKGKCEVIIFHLAHINHCFSIKKRYEKNLKHSNIHSAEFLDQWKDAHMFGTYPNKQVNPTEIPDVILKNFHIDKDKFYFQNRGIEIKHPIMVKQWNDYFKPASVLDLGCGRGPYLYFWKWFVENDYGFNIKGIEISQWAVSHAFTDKIIVGDICEDVCYNKYESGSMHWDLITAIDVLEHLDDEQLTKTLSNMVNNGKRFLFSIPFIEDPNLYKDPTHKIFKDKQWWIEKIQSYGVVIEPTPQDWLFKEQILVGRKEQSAVKNVGGSS